MTATYAERDRGHWRSGWKPGAATCVTVANLFRILALVAVFATVVVPIHPFSSLSNSSALGPWEVGDQLNQVLYTTLAGILLLITRAHGRSLSSQLTFPFVAVLGWIIFTVPFSQNPDLSLRRYAFTLIVLTIAATWFLLPTGLRQLTGVLSVVIATVLVVCYVGVLLVPDLSIHQVSDVLEPQLHGNWRGMYAHKNEAGAVMAFFVLLGAFIARQGSVAIGLSIALASSIFLIFCAAKTSIVLLPLVFVISLVCSRLKTLAAQAAICFTPLFALGAVIVIACYHATTAQVFNLIFPDSSFTGRTDIWKFAIDHALERPFVGQGYMAFWRTRDLSSIDFAGSWAGLAAHSHNGYIDMALTIGVPGAVLAIVFVVIVPLCNFHNCLPFESNRKLSLLFLQLWLFGIYVNCFESALLDRANRIWFFLATAIFGLHFLARYRVFP